MIAPIVSLDPQDSLDYASLLVQAQLFETPYGLTTTAGEPTPVLMAEPLRPLRQGSATYVSTVRHGVRFSDGSHLAALHVLHSLRRSPLIASRGRMWAEAEDIVFDLASPDPAFAVALTKPWCAIALEQPETGRLLGTGPYAVASGSSPERLLLTRNPHHRGAPAAIDEIEIRAYPPTAAGSALRLAVEEGEVDFTNALSRDEVTDLGGVRKIYQPGSSTAFLWLNTDRLPDVRVRRAIALAVDRYALTAKSYANPGAFVARSPLPPRMTQHGDGLRHDPAAARQLLDQVDVERPERLRLVVIWGQRPYMPDPLGWARTLEDQLSSIGIEVEIRQSHDGLDYQRRIRSGDYDMVLGGWNADTNDTYDFVEALFAREAIPAADQQVATGCNFSRWDDELVRGELDRYRTQRSEDALRGILDRAAAEVPVVPLAYGPTVLACSWKLREFEADALGIPRFAELDLKSGS